MSAISKAIELIISSLPIGGGGIFLVEFKEHATIQSLLKNALDYEFISKRELNIILKQKILEVGMNSYQQNIEGKYPPEHTDSAQALAYTIRFLNQRQREAIKYDMGGTERDFLKSYCPKDFPQQLLDQLLAEPKKCEHSSAGLSHCC